MQFHLRGLILVIAMCLLSILGNAQSPTPAEVRAMPDDTNKVKEWSRLASSAAQSNLDSALAFADSTLSLAERIAYPKGVALGNEKLGTAYYYKGQLHNALRYYEKAMNYHKERGNDRNAAIIMTNMGLVTRNLGNYDEAMVYYFDALTLREKTGDSSGVAFVQKSIGETYAIQQDYANAELFFNKALEGYRAIGNTSMEHTMILNMGGYHREKGELDKAMEYILQAKNYFDKHGPRNEVARANYNLGGIYLSRGELDNSEKAYQHAMGFFDSLGFTMRVVGCMISLSEIEQKRGNFSKAIDQANDALTLAEELGTKDQISRALLQLSSIHESSNDYKKALEYRIRYEAVKDSIRSEEVQKTVAELQEKYQSELSEQQLAEITALNEVNELKVKKQQNQQMALVGMVFFSLIVAILLFNQYRAKKRTSDLLLEKNALVQSSLNEKEVLLKEIHHRVKNNLQFISSLLNLQTRHVTDPQALKVLKDGKHRVNSMSLVHQKLYQEENLKGVEMSSYISNLLDSLIHSYEIDRTKVSVITDLDELYLDIDTAIPVGLIMNELITNVLKYAFEGRESGTLSILFKEQDKELLLSVTDDGVGLPKDFSFEQSDQFGFELVESLATKLKAKVKINTDKGTAITLHIRKFNKA